MGRCSIIDITLVFNGLLEFGLFTTLVWSFSFLECNHHDIPIVLVGTKLCASLVFS